MKKITKRLTALLMSVMLTFNCSFVSFAGAETVFAGAFAPVLEYSLLEVLEWLFLSAGVTLTVSDSSLGEEIVEEVADSFALWCAANKFDEDYENLKSQFKIVVNNGKQGCIKVGSSLWNEIRLFCQALAKGETSVKVSNGYDVVTYFNDIVTGTKMENGYNCFFNDNTALDRVSYYASKYGSENVSLYQLRCKYYSGAGDTVAWIMIFGEDTTQFDGTYNSGGSNNYFELYNNPQYVTPACHALLFQTLDYYGRTQFSDSCDLDSIPYTRVIRFFSDMTNFCHSPYQSVTWTQWYTRCQNGITSSNYENIVAECDAISFTNGLLQSGNYDVLSKGQTSVGQGEITITIPDEISVTIDGINKKLDSIEKALEKIQSGEITAGDVLDDAGVVPIDVATGESVYQYANENGETTTIPVEGVVEVVEEIDTPNQTRKLYTDLKLFFPFCIPFDIYDLLSSFVAEPVVPYWEIPFSIPRLGIYEVIVIDFSDFSGIRDILCTLEIAGYILVLAWGTSKVIKW